MDSSWVGSDAARAGGESNGHATPARKERALQLRVEPGAAGAKSRRDTELARGFARSPGHIPACRRPNGQEPSVSKIPKSSSYSAAQYVSVPNVGKPVRKDGSSQRRAIHADA